MYRSMARVLSAIPSRVLLGMALFLLGAISIAHAQSNTGTIVGTVNDDSGAAIPNATVTTKNLGTGEERAVTTDGSGQFTVPNLQIGHYSIRVTRDGFAPAQIADTELQVAQRATINPVLHVGAASDKVTVIAADVPLLNQASSSVGQVIDTQTVQNMPLNGRTFWQLTQLTPGVSYIQGGQNIAAGGDLDSCERRERQCEWAFSFMDGLVSRWCEHHRVSAGRNDHSAECGCAG